MVMPFVDDMKQMIVVREKYVNTSAPGDQSVTQVENFWCWHFLPLFSQKFNFIMYILHVSRLFIKSSEKEVSCLEVRQHH